MELMLHDREGALAAAEEMFAGGDFVALRVTRETLDPETGEFRSATLLRKGPQDEAKGREAAAEEAGPPCRTAEDLYAAPARAQIHRVLEAWLAKAGITPFELLHRPDLIKKLEDSGHALQHALQKTAVPQALARGVGVHETLRALQKLTEQAIGRLRADERDGRFAVFGRNDFDAVCRGLEGAPERLHRLGGGVAGFIAPAAGWSEKVDLLLDLADAAPSAGPARDLAFQALAMPLGDILSSPAAWAELLGPDLDLGGRLAAMTRLAAGDTLAVMIRVDPALAPLVPALSSTALRLSKQLGAPGLDGLLQALNRRILRELAAPRRLRPSDPVGEIAILRVLSMALSAAAGEGAAAEPVREALAERGRSLVGADFITAYLGSNRSAVQEAFDLVRLLETVAGRTNRRQALRWLDSHVAALRFETELTSGAEPPTQRLIHLARLHRRAQRAGADIAGLGGLLEKLAGLGDRVEAEAKLARLVARSAAPLVQKLDLLLKMATGETAPPGAAADRARAEAKRLITSPAASSELTASPEAAARVRAMMKSLQAAA
jgi:hypothetical protein